MNPSLTRHFTDLSSVSGLQAGSSPKGSAKSLVGPRNALWQGKTLWRRMMSDDAEWC